jgi:hypothetical protein
MFRKPLFWIICTVFAMVCVLFTWHYFPKAFPVVTVDISMDRQMAMEQAEEIAGRFEMGPEEYRLAASYSLNSRVQNYVELEAGGADGFRELLDGDLYSPYTWQVRLFRELDANETLIRFTPQGTPRGFLETLSEDEPGAVIPADSARSIAEAAAADFWGVELDAYTLVESSEDMKPGGRLDHTFVYERHDEKLGEAGYRLRLGISGDKFTELTHFVQVPEAFDRRFEELRSANITLASVATIAVIFLFGLMGCGFGLFYLLKQRYVIWKQPVLVSMVIAFLVMMTMFNSWPLQWMNYDTALSYQNHVITQISIALLIFIGLAILYSIIFMTAESLTRKAFPNHIQFWKLWSPGAASTKQVLGITFAALLLVCYELSYVTGTYYFTTNVMDWWYPSSALFSPDVIAEYFPWLTALAVSLQAAFWEEALFRAIPIAGAVLIGQKYGRTTLWVIGAFALQAILFGAVHADYPQLPFYARTVELIIPSVVFGLVFYFLGLYPAILIHFWYNFVWFSLSIFAASIPGILFHQIITVGVGLLPFWIILFQWIRTRRLDDGTDDLYNRAWIPEQEPETEAATPVQDRGEKLIPEFTSRFFAVITAAGIAGLLIWIAVADFGKDSPPVESSRADALEIADHILEQRGIVLDETWQAFSRTFGGISPAHRFVWQKGGPEAYGELLGSYLELPLWYVRYVTFGGEVEDRAEEYRVSIAPGDSIDSFRHIWPEHRTGAELEESEAREIADRTLADVHQLDPEQLRFVSAESSSLPERIDWTMIYSDTLAYSLDDGEARIRVRIAGDQVVGTNRFIHVPDEWTRQFRDSRTIPDIIEMSADMAKLLLFFAGIITAIVRWTKGQFSLRAFMVITGGIIFVMGLNSYNMWPNAQIGFSTAQPYTTQMLTHVGFSATFVMIVSLAFGLLGGFIQRWDLPVSNQLVQDQLQLIRTAIFPVLVVLGLAALVSGVTPQSAPNWGNSGMAGASVPLLAGTLDPLMSFFSAVLLLMFTFGIVHHFTSGWQKRKPLFGLLLFLAGFTAAGSSVETITGWIAGGAVFGALMVLFYVVILRYHMPLVVLMAACNSILGSAGSLIAPMYPGEAVSWILSALLTGTVAWVWHNILAEQQ